MNDECTLTVAGDGKIVIVNLANLPVIKVASLSKELYSGHRQPADSWLRALAKAVEHHLDRYLVAFSVDEAKVLFSLKLKEDAPADLVKLYAEEFLSLSRWNIRVKQLPSVRGS